MPGLQALTSKFEVEPSVSVRLLSNVTVPGLLPGASVAPEPTVIAPRTVPDPFKVWPLPRLNPLTAETLNVPPVPRSTALLFAIEPLLARTSVPAEIEADPKAGFQAALVRMGMEELGLSLNHAARLRDLPRHHADPFDRLLIAQALEDDLTLVTHDRMFKLYGGLKLLWT